MICQRATNGSPIDSASLELRVQPLLLVLQLLKRLVPRVRSQRRSRKPGHGRLPGPGPAKAAQGAAVDIGGYFRPDLEKVTAAMRASATFNRILEEA